MVQSRPGGGNACQQITSDGDDTLNAWRVPSLEKDEETASRRPRTRRESLQKPTSLPIIWNIAKEKNYFPLTTVSSTMVVVKVECGSMAGSRKMKMEK